MSIKCKNKNRMNDANRNTFYIGETHPLYATKLYTSLLFTIFF